MLFSAIFFGALLFFSACRAVSKPSFEVAPSAGPTLDSTGNIASPTSVAQNGAVTFSATVSDVSGVESVYVEVKDSTNAVKARVTLYNDGLHNDGTSTDNIFASSWNVGSNASGSYTLTVQMNDILGNPSSGSGGTLVIGTALSNTNTAPVDTTPPNLSITTPAVDGATITTYSYTVVANASDSESPIGLPGTGKVEFYVDSEASPRDTQYSDSPAGSNNYSSLLLDSLGNGTHTIKVIAYNGLSTPLTATAERTVTISRSTTPPTATITSPANRTVVAGLVDVHVTATDNVTVNTVNLYEVVQGFLGTATLTPAATVNVTITWDATASATTFNSGYFFPYAGKPQEQKHFSLIPKAQAAVLAAEENANCTTTTGNVSQMIYAVAIDNDNTTGTSGNILTFTPVTTTSCLGGTNSGTPL